MITVGRAATRPITGDVISLELPRGTVEANDNAARVEVVVERFAFAEELRGEEDLRSDHAEGAVGEAFAVGELFADGLRVAHGDGGLDDHHRVGIDLEDQRDDLFYVGGVEEVFLGVVVGGRSDDHEVGVAVGGPTVQRSDEVQRFLSQVLLDIVVLDGADLAIDLVHFLRDHVHGHDLVPLREQRRDAESDVSGSGYCYLHDFFTLSQYLYSPAH